MKRQNLIYEEAREEAQWHQLNIFYRELRQATAETPSGTFTKHDEAFNLLHNDRFQTYLVPSALNLIVKIKLVAVKVRVERVKGSCGKSKSGS